MCMEFRDLGRRSGAHTWDIARRYCGHALLLLLKDLVIAVDDACVALCMKGKSG